MSVDQPGAASRVGALSHGLARAGQGAEAPGHGGNSRGPTAVHLPRFTDQRQLH